MNQLFHVSAEVLEALKDDDVEKTCEDLREMGLYRLPFPQIDLAFPCDSILRNKETGKPFDNKLGSAFTVRVNGVTEINQPAKLSFYKGLREIDLPKDQIPFVWNKVFRDCIITILATRNVVKETKVCKAAKLGIGKAKPVITYIKMAATLSNGEHVITGRSVRPHLRRGHIRNQAYGEGHKRIWIEPVFVNADREFVESRKAYSLV